MWQIDYVCHIDKTASSRANFPSLPIYNVLGHRDLGVQVHFSMKVVTRVDRVVKKVFSENAFTSQSIE